MTNSVEKPSDTSCYELRNESKWAKDGALEPGKSTMRDHYQNLLARGWATALTFEKIEQLRVDEDVDAAAILAFHLPYPLFVGRETFTVPGRRPTITVKFSFFPIKIVVQEHLDSSIFDETSWSQFEMTDYCKIFDCTQCVALVPLWQTRRRYYMKYLDLLERGHLGEVLIPSVDNPQRDRDRMPRSVTGDMFEHEMADRLNLETLSAIQLFLKNYIITSLHEVKQPKTLLSRFASTAEGRYFPFGNAGNIVFELLRQRQNKPLRHISGSDMTSALRWPSRDFSSFELQILALKRLADYGDPDLALVGLTALLECHLKSHLSRYGKDDKLHNLLKDPRLKSSVSDEIIADIDLARNRRNQFVHETATNRNPSVRPSSVADHANIDEMYKAFSQAAVAGFELYRLLNFEGKILANSEG